MFDKVDMDRVPRHVAIIMDGNGRWANARGLHRTQGHAAGEPALFDVIDGALELGVEYSSRISASMVGSLQLSRRSNAGIRV